MLEAQKTAPDIFAIKSEYAALHAAQNTREEALHAYLLNDAAEVYADAMNQGILQRRSATELSDPKAETQPMITQANRYRAEIIWCEVNGDWTARPDGYLAYLDVWPDGPFAEEAWWRGKLGHRLTGCFDAEGTEEETADFVADYTEFLQHFPHGQHEKEARGLLKEFQAELDWYKQDRPVIRASPK